MGSVEENSFPVVCIKEYTRNTSNIDTTFFFTYDARYNEYVLWGKRGEKTDDPFMFRFNRFKDMYNFIYVCILKFYEKKFDVGLYNYNNFPMDFDVSYDFLYDNMDESYEIAYIEYVKIQDMTKKYLRKLAHICKYSYNRIDGEIV